MDPFTLVPGENITRYLCLTFGTGWCLPPGTKKASQVTSKGKYLRLSHNCIVDEVVKEIHLRQEVTGSNPSHCSVLLFSFDAVQRYPKVPGHSPGINGWSHWSRMPSSGCKNRYQRPSMTSAKGTFSSSDTIFLHNMTLSR